MANVQQLEGGHDGDANFQEAEHCLKRRPCSAARLKTLKTWNVTHKGGAQPQQLLYLRPRRGPLQGVSPPPQALAPQEHPGRFSPTRPAWTEGQQ